MRKLIFNDRDWVLVPVAGVPTSPHERQQFESELTLMWTGGDTSHGYGFTERYSVNRTIIHGIPFRATVQK